MHGLIQEHRLYARLSLCANNRRAQGYKIACLEEIAFNNKWITKSELIDLIKSYPNNALEEYFSF